MDNIGFHSMEMWGGATFDVCLRYRNEDPWVRLNIIKNTLKKTPVQMLLRGTSLVGYKPYPTEIVELFINKAAKNGVDIFRIFDALNYIGNLEDPIKFVKNTGKHVQGAILYTISPVHDADHFIEFGKILASKGVDSICLKDASGMITPKETEKILSGLKKIGLPLQFHAHSTNGVALVNYVKAMEIGVDILDCAISTFAGGPSQPPLESMILCMDGTDFQHKLDLKAIF